MFLISIVIGLIIFICLIKFVCQQLKFNRCLKHVPGPAPLPLIGNALLFKSSLDLIPVAFRLQKEFKGIFKIYLGWEPRLVIVEPKSAEFLLSSTTIIEKSYEYNFLKPWLGTGLLTSGGAKWKNRRKLITPTFHFQILEQYIGIFNNQSDVLIDCLKNRLDGKSFDIFPYVTNCTLDVICEAAMGTQVNAQKNSNNHYVRNVQGMCKVVMERIFSPLKMIDTLYKLTKTYYEEKSALSVLHNYTTSVINERRENLNKRIHNKNESNGEIKQRLAFLDLLLHCNLNGSNLSTESIREEVDTFMFEGHDTTASGVAFALYALSKHKDVQEKIVKELDEIFDGDRSKAPTYKDLQNMKYLEMAIKEALRLYPPVPIYSRTLEEDVEYDNHILPKGLVLTMMVLCLHRNEEVFPDPEKFDPERFSLENIATRSPYAYVPFSAGPRNCIGQRFAMLELKSIISKVLRNYELLTVPEHEPILSADVILKSHNNLLIRLKKR